MKNLILDLIEGGISLNNIYRKLDIKDEDKKNEVKLLIEKLETKGRIYYDESTNKYKDMPSNRFVTEILSTQKGRKYIKVGTKQVMINSHELNGAITFDKVLIKITNGEYVVEKIINREKSTFICQIIEENGKKQAIPFDKDVLYNINLKKEEISLLDIGDLFTINAAKEVTNKGINATFKEKIGNSLDPDAYVIAICLEHGFRYAFSDETIKEAKELPEEIKNEDNNRVDLRNELIYTIDSFDTKDIDDAISIDYIDDKYVLKVHIAHVSHYVELNSAMFNDALKNTTSIYPPGKVIPMFPHRLSSGICSLNEKVDRLARTTEMHFDKEGNIIESKTYKSVINSKKKMTYDDVNLILEKNEIPKGYEEYTKNLKLAYKLSLLINKQKYQRGYIYFNNNEVHFNYLDNGEIKDVESVKIGSAQELIENFMVATNTTLTNLAPITYRNHLAPNCEKVEQAIKTLKSLDFKLPESKNISMQKYLQIVFDNIENEEEKLILSKIILQSFKKADYGIENQSHFGLGLENYAHTTSPIRRIIDYINQIILDMYEEENLTIEKFNLVNSSLENICKLASEKERLADIVEHRSALIEMAKFMKDKIGYEYTMFISEITPTYIKVSAKGMLEGVINIENFIGDNVYYSNENTLISAKNNWVYKIGHYLKVKVLSVEVCNGLIHYTMEENLNRTEKMNIKMKQKNKL